MTTVEGFSGLDLVSDPEEVTGAIDLLNVDLDKRGRVRSRDGYNNLTASAASDRLTNIAPLYKLDGTKQLLVASSDGQYYRAYSTAGAVVASQAVGPIYHADFTRFGGPAAEVSYASSSVSDTVPLGNQIYKWNGSTWATANNVRLGGAGLFPYALEVQATDNRLVGAFADGNASRLGFSNPGLPETWGANDYVDLTPGDGEYITALVSWREMVFAFKESKYFIFTGNSTSGTGTSIFNYRPVNTGVGTVARFCATTSPNGVYFLSRRGIYRTTGSDPTLVSRDIDPIFRGGPSALYLGGVLNHAAINRCQLAWYDERLYFAYPSGTATANDRLAVFDPESDQWLLWDVAVNGMASFRVGDAAELVFTYAAGSNDIGRLSSAYDDDDGTAITSRYQSGFSDFGSPKAKRMRGLSLWGHGSPTVRIASDLKAADDGGVVALGTAAPFTAKGYQRISRRGTLFSYKLTGTTPWAVNRLDLDIADERVGP